MSLKQLWAPWRMDYLDNNSKGEKHSACVFCHLLSESCDRDNLILCRSENVFVILNKYPYNNGHLMVVPNRHVADFTALTDAELKELSVYSRHAVCALKEKYHASGFNLGMNLGEAGGAGIRDHVHMHIVPRWNGDTNFMPVIAETKSMPQHLLTSFGLLQDYFGRL